MERTHTNTYKLRAEALSDVVGEGGFLAQAKGNGVQIFSYTIEQKGAFGDVTVTFTCRKDLATVRQILSQVIDGHCMLRTVNDARMYTGEQFYFEGE